MFDSLGAFAKQFTPIEGGYLYYPSKKGGGKLVTAEEYDELNEGWRKVAGQSGIWKTVGLAMLVIFVWTFISTTLSLPDWAGAIFIAVAASCISAWLFWAGLAPRRLVRDRPDVAPPRPISQVKRHVRAMLNWHMIIFALLLSGLAFLGVLYSPQRNFASWAWLIGSGAMFGLYFWVAIQKYRDG